MNHQNELNRIKRLNIYREKKKLMELTARKDKLNTDFEQKIEIIKERKIKQILEQHKQSENNFGIGDISKYWEKTISSFIKNLFESEQIISIILYHLKLFVNEFKKKILNIEHLNIILVGPTGVGKSTLINAILNVDAHTCFGKTGTKDINYYESNKIPFLRLADSRGIERDNKYGVDEIFKSIQDFIGSQIESNIPDKFIHCIWYCWMETRLEKCEIKFFNELSKQYSLETIPIIIVYTNSTNKEKISNAKKYIFEELHLKNDFIEILAKDCPTDIGVIPSFGLDKLTEISIKRAKEAVKSSCYEGLLSEIKKKIKITIEQLMKELKNINDIESERIIKNITINSKMEDLNQNITDIIMKIFYQYYFLSPDVKINRKRNRGELDDLNYSISDNSKSIIQDFSTQYFKEIAKIHEDNINSLVDIYSKELSDEILKFQNDFNIKNDNLLDVKWVSYELEKSLKDYIYIKISKTIEISLLKNSFRFIVAPLIQQFGQYFEKSYLFGMGHDEFKNYCQEMSKVSFEKIEQKIKEYNELKKKEKEEEKIEDKKEEKEAQNIDFKSENNIDDSVMSLFSSYDNKKENKENGKKETSLKEDSEEKMDSIKMHSIKEENNNKESKYSKRHIQLV